MTESDYIDYFDNLARKHAAIGHTDDRPHFFVVRDDNRSELISAMRNKLYLPALVLSQYYDDVDRTNDNYRLRIMGGISVLVNCTNELKDIRRARQEARRIALSVLHRMYRECALPGGPLFARKVRCSMDFTGEPADLIGQQAAGWGYDFEWTLPTSVAVDADDWSDLPG